MEVAQWIAILILYILIILLFTLREDKDGRSR